MDLFARLDELHGDEALRLLCVAPTGVQVAEPDPALAEFASVMLKPEIPLDVIHTEDRGKAAGLFAETLLVGYAAAELRSVDGEPRLHELFNETERFGCFVGIVSSADADKVRLSPSDRPDEFPARRVEMRLDAAGRFLHIDRDYTSLFGFTLDELIDEPGGERVHPDDRTVNIRNWSRALDAPHKPQRVRQRTQCKDGSWLWGEWTVTNRLDAPDPHMHIEVIDIDQEMRARKMLEEREALLARLTGALPVGVVHLHRSGEVALSNERWSELTGQPGRSLTTTSETGEVQSAERVFDAFRAAEKIEEACRAVLATGNTVSLRVLIADDSTECTHGDLQVQRLVDEANDATLLLTLTDVSESVALQAKLRFEARNDHLTSILNRQGLKEHIDARLDLLTQQEHKLAMLYLDLDGFKLVNDQCGHLQGDEVLQQLAIRLQDLVRDGDLIGRLGGDEFVVIASVETAAEAQAMQRRIQSRLRIEVQPDRGPPILVTASAGIALAEPGDTFHSLTNRADAAMYRFKDRRSTDSQEISV